MVSTDLFRVGTKFHMVYADRLSCYPEHRKGHKYFTAQFISHWKAVEFRYDGGSQFVCMEIRTFLKQYGIAHGQLSPYNPQCNARAE